MFNSDKIDIPGATYISTIKGSSHTRYKYYGTATKYTGAIFTELKDQTISNSTPFYEDITIEETVERLESGGLVIIFWILWIIFIGFCVYGFYYVDNNWLE